MTIDITKPVLSCNINGRRFRGGTLADWNDWVLSGCPYQKEEPNDRQASGPTA